jgi:hypothetical protein
VIEAGHTISMRESWVGVQDAEMSGVSVCINNDLGVVVLTSQEKWDCMKCICRFWLDLLNQGISKLEHKQLRSDQGFMVYMAQAYPWMKPYVNGFHLLLEKWRDSCNNERWKIQARPTLEDKDTRGNTPEEGSFDDIKIQLLTHSLGEEEPWQDGPSSGLIPAAPCFEEDLEAILHLAEGEHPAPHFVRSKLSMTAYYGFGVASSGGFGVTVERPSGLHSRYGLWKRDEEGQSSNYWELRNLVDTVEEEAKEGYLKGGELWLFTDNSTAESCFYQGGLSAKLLHELVLHLRKAEMKYGFSLHVVHVAGTRMFAQGTDGLSRGIMLEGIVHGNDMLSYVNLSKTAIEQHQGVLDYVKSWLDSSVGSSKLSSPEEWFREGHGIIGGEKGSSGMWIPRHAENKKAYIWAPPPIIADVALEECSKAIHKRPDAYNVSNPSTLLSPLDADVVQTF